MIKSGNLRLFAKLLKCFRDFHGIDILGYIGRLPKCETPCNQGSNPSPWPFIGFCVASWFRTSMVRADIGHGQHRQTEQSVCDMQKAKNQGMLNTASTRVIRQARRKLFRVYSTRKERSDSDLISAVWSITPSMLAMHELGLEMSRFPLRDRRQLPQSDSNGTATTRSTEILWNKLKANRSPSVQDTKPLSIGHRQGLQLLHSPVRSDVDFYRKCRAISEQLWVSPNPLTGRAFLLGCPQCRNHCCGVCCHV